MRRRLLGSALGLILLLTACGPGGGSDVVTIYSGRTSNLVGPILDRFAEQSGISVEVRYGDSAELALLIQQEGERTPADVFYSQSPGATEFLADQNRLATLPTETLALVDPRFVDDEGRWVGVSGRQRVLVYNRDLIEQQDLPESVFDITKPPLAGEVAVAPSNGSFQDFITAMVATEGQQRAAAFLDDLVATDAPTYANNNAIVEAVGRGEVPMGLVNHYYNYRFLDEDPDVPSRNHQFGGDDIGSLLITSPISIIEGTEQPDAAQQLIEFLLNTDSQTYFAQETFEYPATPGVDPASDIPPLDTLDVRSVDAEDLGGGLEDTLELIRDSGLAG